MEGQICKKKCFSLNDELLWRRNQNSIYKMVVIVAILNVAMSPFEQICMMPNDAYITHKIQRQLQTGF